MLWMSIVYVNSMRSVKVMCVKCVWSVDYVKSVLSGGVEWVSGVFTIIECTPVIIISVIQSKMKCW